MEKIERLHQYLNNELEGQELIEFKRQLEANPELQEEADKLEYILNGFRVLQSEAFEDSKSIQNIF